MLAENRFRQVVLLSDEGQGRRIVRRISASPDGPDLVDRAGALGLIRQVRIPGFAMIEDRAIVGSTLEIAESFVEGFTLGQAAEPVRALVSVSVAISMVHDLARGLVVLHTIREPTGRPAKLIHGRLDLDQLMLTPTGEVRAIGLEGARGEPSTDVAALLKVLHSLLVSKANSKAGSGLLTRLSQLRFESAEQMVIALAAYLDRQNEGEVAQRRLAFAGQVAAQIQWTPVLSDVGPAVVVPDTPTDSNERKLGGPPPPPPREHPDGFGLPPARGGRASGGQGPARSDTSPPLRPRPLGASRQVEMDEDGDGPTVTERVPGELDGAEATVDSAPAYPPSGSVDRAARAGILAPASTPAAPLDPSTAERTVSVGDYRVVASIGRGGMGEIYLARPTAGAAYRGLVALKVLGLDDSSDDEALGMFIDEAAIMAHIDHPNVLKVVDFGRAKGRHFLAMEYLEGRPLVRVMIDSYQRENGLDYAVIAAIGVDAARGLFAAHTAMSQQGQPLYVVHRDVSPQNIFITYQGTTKVIDFGVARATQRVSKTAVGVVKGKAAYMSPEQTEGREVDARSDVFSLGICLWEMTAGRRLFKRDSEYETLMAVSTAPVEKPTVVRGQPNPALDRVIMNALVRNRDKRTQSALELSAQLTEIVQASGHKDGRVPVSELMNRLFGAAAQEERALIRTLEARAATEEEADSLRRLSGVSPRKGARPEITIVGAPSGLQELDEFGSEQSFSDVRVKPRSDSHHSATTNPDGYNPGALLPKAGAEKKPVSTGAVVLRAVEAIIAEQAASHAQTAMDGDVKGLPPQEPVAHAPEHHEESDPTSIRSSGSSFAIHDPSDAGEAHEGSATVVPSSSITAEPGARIDFVEGTTTAKRPAQIRKKKVRRMALLLSILGLVLVTGAVGLFVPFEPIGVLASLVSKPPPPPSSEERAVNRARIAPVVIEANAAALAEDEATTATVAGTIAALLEDAKRHGFAVTDSEGTYLFDDGKESTVVIDHEARVYRLKTPHAQGWLVETAARGLTQVVWIGAVDQGAYFARPLSVNDCQAKVEVKERGLKLRYRKKIVDLPHGGGSLHDVSLSRPAFAQRVEIEPLGLAFGQRSDGDGTEVLRCGIGWWGGHVVLRSLPEGRYTLKWIGPGKIETTSLEVGPKEVKGGRLVRSSSTAR